jgi:hypothetical protein
MKSPGVLPLRVMPAKAGIQFTEAFEFTARHWIPAGACAELAEVRE